ncbi:hypothetical protein ABZ370_08245 [Streptomyces sp. NPDC005962]|uniref:hypothetical protein n=1 Tax=Streptomyces sp. NPDC005962 TaxID=3154466 RepID=UPI00340BB067
MTLLRERRMIWKDVEPLTGLLFGACAVLVAVSAATYTACAPPLSRDEPFFVARRARLSIFTASFVSSFLAVPSIAKTADGLIERPGIATLCSHLAAELVLLGMQIMNVNWTHPTACIRKAIGVRIVIACCVMATVIWQFHRINVPSEELAYGAPDSSAVATYMLMQYGFLTVAGTATGLRYAALSCAIWRRRRAAAASLAAIAAGTLLAVVYAGSRMGAVLAHLGGLPWPSAVGALVVPTAGALSLHLITVGFTLPLRGQRATLPIRPWAAGS